MRGETVRVYPKLDSTHLDEYGQRLSNTAQYLEVDDVLVHPSSTTDVLSSVRDEGVQTLVTFHFPKTFAAEICGATIVRANGAEYQVVGSPERYQEQNTPTRWNMSVQAKRSDG